LIRVFRAVDNIFIRLEVEATSICMSDEVGLLCGCGEFCGSCAYHTGEKQPLCPGCASHKGRPFWGVCKIYDCIAEHGVEHCGKCEEFPCDSFIDHYEESTPEGQRNAVFRAGLLAYRARHGDVKTLELLRKL